MNYDDIKWNQMIYGPAYYDEGEQEEPAPLIISAWRWEVRLEGRQVFWRFESKIVGDLEALYDIVQNTHYCENPKCKKI